MTDKPMGPVSTIDGCTVHVAHDPEPTYCEIHHVIPQAWQIHWQPPQPWPNEGPSPDHAGITLWDARTVTVCRTGHGNIHYWLVKTMRAIAALASPGETTTWALALADVRATALADGHAPGHADIEWAMQAISRYASVGGSIGDLIDHKLWGEI